jgi:hypothetical protein
MQQTYNRSYLRALPNRMRKEALERITQRYVNQIIENAQDGKTSTFINLENKPSFVAYKELRPYESPPTNDEVRETLLEKFPDCTITYEEKWIDISPGKRELKKGLVVDWS